MEFIHYAIDFVKAHPWLTLMIAAFGVYIVRGKKHAVDAVEQGMIKSARIPGSRDSAGNYMVDIKNASEMNIFTRMVQWANEITGGNARYDLLDTSRQQSKKKKKKKK